MDFWNWLVTPQGIPVLVGIIGVLGTAMAVAATVITQLVVEKNVREREVNRFNYEKQRDVDAAEAAEKARFETVKREAYVEYLTAGVSLVALYETLNKHRFARLLPSMYRTLAVRHDTLTRRVVEIRLISPEVHAETFEFGSILVKSDRSLFKPIPEVEVEKAYEALKRVRRVMQRSLGLEPEEDSGLWAIDNIGRPKLSTIQHIRAQPNMAPERREQRKLSKEYRRRRKG